MDINTFNGNTAFTVYLYSKYPPLLTVKLLSEIISVEEQTIRNWLTKDECPIPTTKEDEGDVNSSKKGKKKFPVRFRITDVAEYIEKIFSSAKAQNVNPVKPHRGRPSKAEQIAKRISQENCDR